jgi:hypothetical protein
VGGVDVILGNLTAIFMEIEATEKIGQEIDGL